MKILVEFDPATIAGYNGTPYFVKWVNSDKTSVTSTSDPNEKLAICEDTSDALALMEAAGKLVAWVVNYKYRWRYRYLDNNGKLIPL
jgi:hypothetical protein